MHRTHALASPVVCLLLIAILPGCGERGFPTAPVRGKVTYNGKPVTSGTVLFMPDGDKPSATGELEPDGSYSLTTYRSGDGAVLGKHSILITAIEDQSNRLPEERNPAPGLTIPARYNNFATSGLSAEVVEGANTVDFELRD